MIKKISLLLLICILSALNINAEVYEGSCGDNVKYSLDTETGLLSITGTGAMKEYSSYSSIPWDSQRSIIFTVEISDGVTSIGNHAFSSCSSLVSIEIPNSVTSIGDRAFSSCSSLVSIEIPNSVTSIGDRAFYYCSGLKSVTIPNSVTSIGDNAFSGCSKLVSIEIPNSFTTIGSFVFSDCSGLTSIKIPNSVTSIGSSAFLGCSKLVSIEIPNSVTSIGSSAFSGCSKLTSVHITDIAAWCKISFYDSYSNPLCCAQHLFMDGKEIKDLTIPSSISSIKKYTFYGCSGLTSITIPNNVTSIDNSAFFNCSGLKSVTIPNSVTSIDSYAFEYCSNLTSVTIGSNVKSIGGWAFGYCSELLDVYCYARKSPTMGNNVFNHSGIQFATLYVPESSINGYKATEPWSGFGTIQALSGEYPDIPQSKCATPIINFENGKLSFSCETEGVKYVCNFSTPSVTYEEGVEASMPEKLQVSVYAKKDGYENSDVATKEIDLGTSGVRGDLNGDGVVSMPDAMFIVNKMLNGKFPDEEFSTAGIRFGFYETIPGYSVKINKLNITGLRSEDLGSNLVGTTLGTYVAQSTFDRADGGYTNVLFKDANDNPIVIELDYTLIASDGTGETIYVSGAEVTIPTEYIQWKPDYSYTYIFKIRDNYYGDPSYDVLKLYPVSLDTIIVDDSSENRTITTIPTQ